MLQTVTYRHWKGDHDRHVSVGHIHGNVLSFSISITCILDLTLSIVSLLSTSNVIVLPVSVFTKICIVASRDCLSDERCGSTRQISSWLLSPLDMYQYKACDLTECGAPTGMHVRYGRM